MIYSLRGKLIFKDVGTAVIECMGVGYRCLVSQNTAAQLPTVGKEAFLLTYMQVRDDSIELFGFADNNELASFKLLTTVNGVGAKVALVILSVLSVERIALAVASGDEKTLQQCPGVGKKLASRIVLELKDKMGSFGSSSEMEKIASAAPSSQGKISEAAQALVSLGYTQSSAAVALSGCNEEMTVEEMIKKALKKLAKG